MQGGSHTTFGANWAREAWEELSDKENAELKRWEAWPQKIYAFKEKPEEVRDLLLFLAEMDNVSYQIVNHLLLFHFQLFVFRKPFS